MTAARSHVQDTPDSLVATRHSQSGTLFRNLSILALTGHAAILVATWLVEIWPLVLINVISIALYATGLALNRRRWYLAVLAIGLFEVTAHAVVATAILGWASGFHIYILALVPLVFFFDPWSMRARAATSFVIIVFYVVFAWFAYRFLEDDPRWFVEWFRYGNLLIGAIVLSALSYYYGTAVRRAQIDLEEKNARLDALARTDHLTGLPNRREALALIEWERVRSARTGEVFAIAIIDVDHFKRINDDHGHACGDLALQRVAEALRHSLRAQDSIARWGGEEFLLILPRTDRDGAMVAAEKARSCIGSTDIQLAEAVVRVTVTIGVSIVAPGSDVTEVLKRADRALYDGKDAGRDRVQFSW